MGLIFLYFLLHGIYIKVILKALNYDITLRKGMFYAAAEFYFSGITPSATGGQPVQLYYMTKDNIPIRKSYITLLLNTVYFKLIMLLFGILVLAFGRSYVFGGAAIYRICFFFGFAVDVVFVSLGALLLFKVSFVEYMYKKFAGFLKGRKFFGKTISEDPRVIEKYKDEIEFIKSHKKLVVITFFVTLLQRTALFSIIYVIYAALGCSGFGFIEILVIQLSVQLAIESLPTPGGTGVSESMLHSIFRMIFSVETADIGMLLTRTFSFYVPLILCGLSVPVHYLAEKASRRRRRRSKLR